MPHWPILLYNSPCSSSIPATYWCFDPLKMVTLHTDAHHWRSLWCEIPTAGRVRADPTVGCCQMAVRLNTVGAKLNLKKWAVSTAVISHQECVGYLDPSGFVRWCSSLIRDKIRSPGCPQPRHFADSSSRCRTFPLIEGTTTWDGTIWVPGTEVICEWWIQCVFMTGVNL